VREVIGPECELMVDYNQALTVEEAIERIRILDREPLAWVEEPNPRRRLRRPRANRRRRGDTDPTR
jgi:mandelate racemase